jgi:hypothetical protein
LSSRTRAEPPSLVPCDELPAAVAALSSRSEIESFGIAPAASVAVVAIRPPGDGGRSLLRVGHAGEAPRDIEVGGRVLGLVVAADGSVAYAVVRTVDRKGVARNVELLRVDLATSRASVRLALPGGARGVTIAADGSTLFVASRDEIRTFRLPGLESGPLFRVPGDNIGVVPIPSSTTVLVAQRLRLALGDLSAPQSRDGLELRQSVDAPSAIRVLVASAGDTGPIALSEDGSAWCVRTGSLPPAARAPAASAETAPAERVPAETQAVEPVPPALPPAEVPPPPATAEAPRSIAAESSVPAESGAVSGTVAGPGAREVETIVFLGPDNVLREAARVVPDGQGRFSVPELPSGMYRVVAAGRGGRVLICDPPYATVRVGSKGAIETPVLNVVRAQ